MSTPLADITSIEETIERSKQIMAESMAITKLNAEKKQALDKRVLNCLTPEILDQPDIIPPQVQDEYASSDQASEPECPEVRPGQIVRKPNMNISGYERVNKEQETYRSSIDDQNYINTLETKVGSLEQENTDLRNAMSQMQEFSSIEKDQFLRLKDYLESEGERYKGEIETLKKERDSIKNQYNKLHEIHSQQLNCSNDRENLLNELDTVKTRVSTLKSEFQNAYSLIKAELDTERKINADLKNQLSDALSIDQNKVLSYINSVEGKIKKLPTEESKPKKIELQIATFEAEETESVQILQEKDENIPYNVNVPRVKINRKNSPFNSNRSKRDVSERRQASKSATKKRATRA